MVTPTPTLLSDVARTAALDVAEQRYACAATWRTTRGCDPTVRRRCRRQHSARWCTATAEATTSCLRRRDRNHPRLGDGVAVTPATTWATCAVASTLTGSTSWPVTSSTTTSPHRHGVEFDAAELRQGVEAAYRINAVFQLLVLTVFEGQGDNTGIEMAIAGSRAAAGLTTTGRRLRRHQPKTASRSCHVIWACRDGAEPPGFRSHRRDGGGDPPCHEIHRDDVGAVEGLLDDEVTLRQGPLLDGRRALSFHRRSCSCGQCLRRPAGGARGGSVAP